MPPPPQAGAYPDDSLTQAPGQTTMTSAAEQGPAVVLPAILDVRAASPLAAELTARRGQHVTVDASQVRRLGAQCLQVLLAARNSWKADGAEFRVVASSDDFADGLRLLGAASLVPHTEG